MANNYTDGTGSLVFDGEPKLSPISTILMNHVHQYDAQYAQGFYLEDGAYVSTDDVVADLIDYALTLIGEGKPGSTKLRRQLDKTKQECIDGNHDAYQRLPGLLRKAGVPVNNALERALCDEATHPIDYVIAVADDEASNLLQVQYEEANTCDKMRLGEFGGGGVFYSRYVDFCQFSGAGVHFAEQLHNAVRDAKRDEVLSLVTRQLARVFNTIRDPDLREQVAKALLKDQALATVEDGIVNGEG